MVKCATEALKFVRLQNHHIRLSLSCCLSSSSFSSRLSSLAIKIVNILHTHICIYYDSIWCHRTIKNENINQIFVEERFEQKKKFTFELNNLHRRWIGHHRRRWPVNETVDSMKSIFVVFRFIWYSKYHHVYGVQIAFCTLLCASLTFLLSISVIADNLDNKSFAYSSAHCLLLSHYFRSLDDIVLFRVSLITTHGLTTTPPSGCDIWYNVCALNEWSVWVSQWSFLPCLPIFKILFPSFCDNPYNCRLLQ